MLYTHTHAKNQFKGIRIKTGIQLKHIHKVTFLFFFLGTATAAAKSYASFRFSQSKHII